MKRLALLALPMVLGCSAPSTRLLDGYNHSPLSLEIKVEKGAIIGYIRNTSRRTIETDPYYIFTYWEFFSLFYRGEMRWREVPYKKDGFRPVMSYFSWPRIELKPGELLRSKSEDSAFSLSKETGNFTFKIELSAFEIPKVYPYVLQIRVSARDLWSNIVLVNTNEL